MKARIVQLAVLILYLLFSINANGQKVSSTNGIKVVENGNKGAWGKNPQFKLEYEGKFGNHNDKDESSWFKLPEDISFDKNGNIYVLDGGQQQILKYDRNKKLISSFGRKGKGPGEMTLPDIIDISPDGKIYVNDEAAQRVNIFLPDGKYETSIKVKWNIFRFLMPNNELMVAPNRELNGRGASKPLLYFIDKKGKIIKEFGEGPFPKGSKRNSEGAGGGWNRINFAVDKNMNVYAGFKGKNWIEKYDKTGKLLLRIITGNGISGVSNYGIAIDSKERIWVLTQVKVDRDAGKRTGKTMKFNGRDIPADMPIIFQSTSSGKQIIKPKDLKLETKCDLYALDLYDKDGTFLYSFPIGHYINNNDLIKISNNKIYILEQIREGTFHVYKISDL